MSFWALWCASNPSDKLFSDAIWTSSTLGLPPNQRTQRVDSHCGLSAFGVDTIFPGQAVWPRTAPQTKLPTLNIDDEHVPTIDCDVDAEFEVGACAEYNGDDASTSLVVYMDHFICVCFIFMCVLSIFYYYFLICFVYLFVCLSFYRRWSRVNVEYSIIICVCACTIILLWLRSECNVDDRFEKMNNNEI